eukprot:TRINITY_DN1647_c0_g1_i2.p1 TRINITY_DN1647_c0_g1~~TRINITY_DN1647_c0_g1_i2.p1  ORF type:complete len:126 (+),score=27.93 TRINITY_DN1647_c0_g1_i2:59-436(+)
MGEAVVSTQSTGRYELTAAEQTNKPHKQHNTNMVDKFALVVLTTSDNHIWREAFSQARPTRSKYGLEDAHIGHDINTDNAAILVLRIANEEQARKYFASDDWTIFKHGAGVIDCRITYLHSEHHH